MVVMQWPSQVKRTRTTLKSHLKAREGDGHDIVGVVSETNKEPSLHCDCNGCDVVAIMSLVMVVTQRW